MIAFILALACGEGRRIEKADEALRAGELTTAESYYREVLDRDPDQVDALYGLGWIYHLGQDPDRAREYFMRCNRVALTDQMPAIRRDSSSAEINPSMKTPYKIGEY